MNIHFSKNFDIQFRKLSKEQKRLARDTIELFIDNPHEASLRNHPLKGDWGGYRSISADNDLRLHFKLLDRATALFVAIGTHKQLYK